MLDPSSSYDALKKPENRAGPPSLEEPEPALGRPESLPGGGERLFSRWRPSLLSGAAFALGCLVGLGLSWLLIPWIH